MLSDANPRFSVVSAAYNVEKYLDDFIQSIESQTSWTDELEVIMVDDGSTDGSLAVLQDWQRRRPDLVRVLSKPNGGQASARNLGLDHARGEWVTFTDPDDMLEPSVLAEVATFLNEFPTTQLVALSRVLLMESTGRRAHHPLRRHFAQPNRLRNLDEHPNYFFGSAPSAFFRRALIEDVGLRFPEDIRPNFEDGYFCDVYLLLAPAPLVGFVHSAEYVYRKRADQSSTLNLSRADAGRFTAVLEHGYLGLLRECIKIRGEVPGWVQTHLLYELSWYFSSEEAYAQAETAAVGEVAATFHRLLAQIVDMLDPEAVRTFSLRAFKPIWRDVLLHGYRHEPWHTDFVLVDKLDIRQRAVRVNYRFTHELPREEFFVEGVATLPVFDKVRAPVYFDRTLVRERIVWLPYGDLRVRLDGVDVDVRLEEPQQPVHVLNSASMRRALDPRAAARRAAKAAPKPRLLRHKAVTRLARTKVVRRYFADAWVLMDRIADADDSAEHLFRYLRAHRPSTNAWFVIERGTPGYRRLREDGHRRVIPHGSLVWRLLMLNCQHLISSHADVPVIAPAAVTKLAPPRWRITFLQHGVIKDDLSKWLNVKDLDLFVTSTRAEYDSIAGDDTPYRFTSREVILTGLPRFDRILEAGAAYPPDRRDLILIAPTWRNWLVKPVARDTQEWGIDVRAFLSSEFAQNWLAVLRSPELAALAQRSGLRIGLLLHPNLQAVAPALGLPADMQIFDFEQDVRQVFARARVLVTDYSSMAFNAAYIERPIVYFQFDQQRMMTGGHVGRAGYFDYARDGYGPVTLTAEDAIKATVDVVDGGPDPAPQYLQRIADAFPRRDGRCCERVVHAIERSTLPVDPQPATLPGQAPEDEATISSPKPSSSGV